MSEKLRELSDILRSKSPVVGHGTFSCVVTHKDFAYKWQPLYDECAKYGEFLRQVKELCIHKWLSDRTNYVIPFVSLRTRCVNNKIWASCLKMPLCGQRNPRSLQQRVNCCLFDFCHNQVLSASTCAVISQDILKAISFMHENGVSHLDLNPRNILVKFVSDKPEIFIADFGLSECLYDDEKIVDDSILKVALWWRQHKKKFLEDDMGDGFDTDIDVFSWAIITFELLCNVSGSVSYASLWSRNSSRPTYDCYQAVLVGMKKISDKIKKSTNEQNKKLLSLCDICFTPNEKLPTARKLLELHKPIFSELAPETSTQKTIQAPLPAVSAILKHSRKSEVKKKLIAQMPLLCERVCEEKEEMQVVGPNLQVYKALFFYCQIDRQLKSKLSEKWKWILTYAISLAGDQHGEYLIKNSYTDFLISKINSEETRSRTCVISEGEMEDYYKELPYAIDCFSNCVFPMWYKLTEKQKRNFAVSLLEPPKKRQKCVLT